MPGEVHTSHETSGGPRAVCRAAANPDRDSLKERDTCREGTLASKFDQRGSQRAQLEGMRNGADGDTGSQEPSQTPEINSVSEWLSGRNNTNDQVHEDELRPLAKCLVI